MCHWLFTRIAGDMIHTQWLRTPRSLENPPKLIWTVTMSIWRYMPGTATGKLRSWKGIDDCFSHYDMSESGMTSSGDRKQQDQSTDIMICWCKSSVYGDSRFHPHVINVFSVTWIKTCSTMGNTESSTKQQGVTFSCKAPVNTDILK